MPIDPMPTNEKPTSMDVLDYWTQIALDAYWKELVKETQQANFTGNTPSDSATGDITD